MQRHFHEELEALKQTLLAMGGLVEDQIRRVMRALIERDDALAQEVIARQREKSDQEVNVVDLGAAVPDYARLLQEIFAADSVAVW